MKPRQTYTIPSLSFEGRLGARLARWGMSADSLTLLANLSGLKIGKTRLAGAVSGRESALPNEIAEKLEPILQEIDQLEKAVAPLVLHMNNAPLLSQWLETRRRGELTIAINGVSHD